ncbi:uncharacterized protein BDR25DRAFT_317338 [Lindgomyces ingoldianus]|uniref:Uncharacterized protein n=1 Tax=Lindgomyces ingoldianus TaxID=673940 RepID=A0ACB6QJF5_9PLEO|nr:uncharacterized protein BDR25DRAFT_317338 [Lindgomyces ingoldianus]KAF2467128.1 hypothetical protein BDR25DRAFT_317338 [Lindgomyces ingoldianus]
MSTVQSTLQSPSPPSTSTTPGHPHTYNLMENYIPCIHPLCSEHYLLSSLSPTFYTTQKPYGLRHKRGLCPSHAYKDLKAANDACRREWESMRQNAGRKNLSVIASEHEAWICALDVQRSGEAAELEDRQKQRVLGWEDPTSPILSVSVAPLVALKTGGSEKSKPVLEQWDWRYMPRPCTRKGCKRNWYSPFSATLYQWYLQECKFGLTMLETLCPECTRADIEALVENIEKKKAIKEEEWEIWLEKVRKDREVERAFWEQAQSRVVKERGMRFKVVEEKKELELEGKGFEMLKELCVVM